MFRFFPIKHQWMYTLNIFFEYNSWDIHCPYVLCECDLAVAVYHALYMYTVPMNYVSVIWLLQYTTPSICTLSLCIMWVWFGCCSVPRPLYVHCPYVYTVSVIWLLQCTTPSIWSTWPARNSWRSWPSCTMSVGTRSESCTVRAPQASTSSSTTRSYRTCPNSPGSVWRPWNVRPSPSTCLCLWGGRGAWWGGGIKVLENIYAQFRFCVEAMKYKSLSINTPGVEVLDQGLL